MSTIPSSIAYARAEAVRTLAKFLNLKDTAAPIAWESEDPKADPIESGLERRARKVVFYFNLGGVSQLPLEVTVIVSEVGENLLWLANYIFIASPDERDEDVLRVLYTCAMNPLTGIPDHEEKNELHPYGSTVRMIRAGSEFFGI